MLGYIWDAKTRSYKDGKKTVTDEALRTKLRRVTVIAEQRLADISQQYVDGDINLAQWELNIKKELRAGHRAMAHIAFGSGKLTAKQLGWLGGMVKKQYAFLANFANEVEAEKVTGQAIIGRSRLYAAGLHATHENLVSLREGAAGMKYCQWILNDGAAHCLDEGSCPEQAKRGRVLIKDSPPIGSRKCLARCRCWKKYFTSKK